MKELQFPLLRAEDIEARIGQVSKDGTKATLLLYKTARTDSTYLDNVVGAYNWQCRFYECKGVMICSVGIYNEDRKEWIWKDDAGSVKEDGFEQDKTLASDSFKRACTKWSLGKELYSAPTMWIDYDSKDKNAKWAKYDVKSVSYDENRKIKTIEIIDQNGVVVYPRKKSQKVAQNGENAPKNDIVEKKEETFVDYYNELENFYLRLAPVRQEGFMAHLSKEYQANSVYELSEEIAKELYNKWVLGKK